MLPVENSIKTIYEYDEEDGHFTQKSYAQFLNGRWNMPMHTTEIPPPKVFSGEVAVFQEKENRWEVILDPSNERYKLSKVSHVYADYFYPNSAKQKEVPVVFEIRKPNSIIDPTVVKVMDLLSSLKALDRYISWFSASIMFAVRIDYLNKKIEHLYKRYSKTWFRWIAQKLCGISDGASLDYEVVEIVHGIKKLLDIVVIAKYLEIDAEGQRLNAQSVLEFDGLGELLSERCKGNEEDRKKQRELREKVRECLYFDKYKGLYQTINDVHNAFKHDILVEQINNSVFPEPFLNVCKFKNSRIDLKDVVHYQIELRKVIWALNDLFDALLNKKALEEVVVNFELVMSEHNSQLPNMERGRLYVNDGLDPKQERNSISLPVK